MDSRAVFISAHQDIDIASSRNILSLSSRSGAERSAFLRTHHEVVAGMKKKRFAHSREYPTHHDETVMNGAPRSGGRCEY